MTITPAEVIWALIVVLCIAAWRAAVVLLAAEEDGEGPAPWSPSRPARYAGPASHFVPPPASDDRGATTRQADRVARYRTGAQCSRIEAEARRTDTLIWHAAQVIGGP